MSKPAWTPGPWSVKSIPGHGDSIVGAGGLQVVRIGQISKMDLANARLIAAAPELYEALKAFMFADGHDDFEDEWPAARAALAKAEGRQP